MEEDFTLLTLPALLEIIILGLYCFMGIKKDIIMVNIPKNNTKRGSILKMALSMHTMYSENEAIAIADTRSICINNMTTSENKANRYSPNVAIIADVEFAADGSISAIQEVAEITNVKINNT